MSRSGQAIRSVVAEACRGRIVGVEREYEIGGPDGPIDARGIWAALPDPGVWLDPSDPYARRGRWGGVITADGPHAELATPPIRLAPGCTDELLGLAAAGERHLAAQLSGHRLIGYSTHINVEVADRSATRIARLIAGRLAVPIMLLLDRAGSPGLLVRPRPGRLEVGGEFAAGDQLRAAIAMTIGMVVLAERSVAFHRRPPMGPVVTPERAVERFGWYVDRAALGPDLYAQGRATKLGLDSAQDVMTRLWSAARVRVGEYLSADEIDLVDAVVRSQLALPLEQPTDDDGPVTAFRHDRSYGPRRRGEIEVSVYRATWWKAALSLRRNGIQRWLTVPGRSLDAVLDAVDSGALDDDLRRIML